MKDIANVRIALAALAALVLAACGADHHGRASGDVAVPRTAEFSGIWMGDAAYRDFRTTMGDAQRFCAAAAANPTRHGVSVHRLGSPSVRIFQIVKGGTVYRWAPGLAQADQRQQQSLVIGRIDNTGRATMPGYRDLNLGALRFDGADHLAQMSGDNMFPSPPSGREASGADGRLAPYPDQSSAPDRERGFTRVDAGFAQAYVAQIRNCFPECYSNQPSCPQAPALPTARPTDQGSYDPNFDPNGANTRPGVQPAPAPVRRSGHKALPPSQDPTLNAPVDDQSTADRPADQSNAGRPAAPREPRGYQQDDDIGPTPGYDPNAQDN